MSLTAASKKRRIADDDDEISSSSLVTSSTTRRRRRMEKGDGDAALLTNLLPEATLFQIIAYTDRPDIAALCRVCKNLQNVISGRTDDSHAAAAATAFWRGLAIRSVRRCCCGPPTIMLDEIWKSLRGHAIKSHNDDDNNNNNNEPLDDVALWKRIIVSKERSSCSVMEENAEYHDVSNEGLPPYELEEEFPTWMRPFGSYQFVVSVWNADGKKLSCTVDRPVLEGSNIRMGLEKSSAIGKVFQSGEFHALEIVVYGSVLDRANRGPLSAVLYSSTVPLEAYGGGSFKEYSAMPWLTRCVDEEVAEHWPDRYGWLPFVEISLPEEETGNGSSNQMVMGLEMQWRRRTTSSRRGDDCTFIESMNYGEILTLLKHRSTYKQESLGSSSEEPYCYTQSPSGGVSFLTEDYEPKNLRCYSFLIELKNTKDPTKNRSIFYECLSDSCLDENNLHFDIPMDYEDSLPWFDDYKDLANYGTPSAGWVDIDNIFSVFVIDRLTGKQAKLYESKKTCSLFEYFSLSYYCEFEKSAALTQFCNGSEVDTIPVPSIQGLVSPSSKEELQEEGRDELSFSLYFQFLFYKNGNPGTGLAVGEIEFDHSDILTFLEKGLVYK